MILGICWSRLSELNDLFRAFGIYPELVLNQDLVTITKGRNCSMDQNQKGLIYKVAENQPKNVFIWGPPGSGKTLLAAEVVKMKLSFYFRKFNLPLEEFNKHNVKVIVCAYSSIPLPLLFIDLQDEVFFELRKRFNFSFYLLQELCEELECNWLPFEPQKCIQELIEYRLSKLGFKKIILLIDEVNPGFPGNWSDFNLDFENVDTILAMRYRYDINDVDHVGTTFQMIPPSDQKLTLSHELVTRYRCGKEIQMLSLFHEKHSGDAYKISGNHENVAEIGQLSY